MTLQCNVTPQELCNTIVCVGVFNHNLTLINKGVPIGSSFTSLGSLVVSAIYHPKRYC